jgi:glycerol-3-phosphate O-acyltransferase
MCLVSINGLILKVRQGDMLDDAVEKDVVCLSAGPPISCEKFRERIRAEVVSMTPGSDKKQAVADAIMAELEKLHIKSEEKRRELMQFYLAPR